MRPSLDIGSLQDHGGKLSPRTSEGREHIPTHSIGELQADPDDLVDEENQFLKTGNKQSPAHADYATRGKSSVSPPRRAVPPESVTMVRQ